MVDDPQIRNQEIQAMRVQVGTIKFSRGGGGGGIFGPLPLLLSLFKEEVFCCWHLEALRIYCLAEVAAVEAELCIITSLATVDSLIRGNLKRQYHEPLAEDNLKSTLKM
jgi:hypothetical protein